MKFLIVFKLIFYPESQKATYETLYSILNSFQSSDKLYPMF